MNRALSSLLTAMVFAAGCGATKYTVKGASSANREDVYSCCVRELTVRDYDIESGDRGAGFVTGVKSLSDMASVIWFGTRQFDSVTITVAEMGNDAPLLVRASGESYQVSAGLFGGNKGPITPTAEVQQDVRDILESCHVTGATESKKEMSPQRKPKLENWAP